MKIRKLFPALAMAILLAVNPSEETLRKSIRETGDPSLAWIAEIPYSTLVSALQ